jgi:hypothetical protein
MLNSEEYKREQNYVNQCKSSYIPTKYKKEKSNLESLCTKYTTHIRNLNALDKKMLDNVHVMTDKEKIDIIIALNDVVNYTVECLHFNI